MSNVYMQEPPTNGKVILHTTHGDIEIELWTKEIPKACRNFIQLCLESYYDNTIFHRIIRNFIVQTGDPTGTGLGGESIYGTDFNDEFHSRLRFNHRGIVAMANPNKPNANGSQFFFSLDNCDFLNRKHTIFGKVVGDTMYNLLGMGEEETDKNDRPTNPPKIIRTEVTLNPYDDIFPRNQKTAQKRHTPDVEKKKKKPVQNRNLLSFDDELDEEEFAIPATTKKKILNAHDSSDDPSLSKEYAVSMEVLEKEKERMKISEKKREKLRAAVEEKALKQRKKEEEEERQAENTEKKEEEEGKNSKNVLEEEEKEKSEEVRQFESKMKRLLIKKRHIMDDYKKINIDDELDHLDELSSSDSDSASDTQPKTKDQLARKAKEKRKNRLQVHKTNKIQLSSSESESDPESDEEKYLTEEQKEELKKAREEFSKLKRDLIKFKRIKTGSVFDDSVQNQNLQKLMTPLERQRYEFLKNKRLTKNREKGTMVKLDEFRKKLHSVEVKNDEENWMNNKLKFHIDSDHAYNLNKAVQNNALSTQLAQIEEKNKRQQIAQIMQSQNNQQEDDVQLELQQVVSMNELMEHIKDK